MIYRLQQPYVLRGYSIRYFQVKIHAAMDALSFCISFVDKEYLIATLIAENKKSLASPGISYSVTEISYASLRR
jgi:hypothetical protein